MPRKRKGINSVIFKQKKIIASRLMEISMKLEDYVYKNRPIPESAAELYAQEVTSYRDICRGDERSLQVIEKITRCMKGIITEAQERNGVDSIEKPSQTVFAAPSPVKSLPGEDLQLPQLSSAGTAINMINDNEKEQNIDVHSTDGVGRFKNKTVMQERTNLVANVRRAISTLFIKDNAKQHEFNNFDNAQSVLDAYIETNINNSNVSEATVRYNACKELSTSSCINIESSTIMNHVEAKAGETYLKSNTVPCAQTASENIHEKNIANVSVHTLKENTYSNKQSEDNTNSVSRLNSNSVLKQTCKETSDAFNEKCVWKDLSSNIPQPVIRNKNYTQIVCKNPIPKKARKVQAPKIKSNTPLQGDNSPIKTKRNPKNKSVPKIYRKNTENDLSWVENIRYVREVATDEYDIAMANLPDAFWENYALPDTWDDREFDYM